MTMTTDEAVQVMLTHRCRFRPGLKLRPEHCERYRKKGDKSDLRGGYSMGSLCHEWQCEGPVILEANRDNGDSAKEEGSIMPPRRKRKLEPTACRTCGLALGFVREDGTDVRFYPSRPDECTRCIVERNNRNRENKKGGEMSAVTSATEAALAEMDRYPDPPDESPVIHEEEEHKFICALHGPHSGRTFGKQFSTVCPKCHTEKMSRVMKAARARKKYGVDANGMSALVLPDWVSAWIAEQAESHGTSPISQLLDLIVPHIPGEWLRDWMIRRSVEGGKP
jgi:hypothetical protein